MTFSLALPNLPKSRVTRRFKRGRQDRIVSLDIGTSKVMVVVAGLDAQGGLTLEGFGSARSEGLKEGTVVDIEEIVESIRSAVSEAEAMAECTIRKVNIGIAGSHAQSFNSTAAIPIRKNEITPMVVKRVLDAASTVKLAEDKSLLQVLPREFGIDDQYGIRMPLGMSGVRLDARVHLVTVGTGALHNLLKSTRLCGLKVDNVTLESLAASDAVLDPSERELGVCLIDIGAGTTDIALWGLDAVQYTATVPIAGDHVDRDIAIALNTRVDDAEQLKIEHGRVFYEAGEEDTMLGVPGLGGRSDASVPRSKLTDAIRARYIDLFERVDAELQRSGHQNSAQGAGMVLTGGGSMLQDLEILAEKILNRPVRTGYPRRSLHFRDDRFKQPIYATGIGLLTYRNAWQSNQEQLSGMHSWFQRIYHWI